MRLTKTSVFFALITVALFAVTGCATNTQYFESNVIRSENIEIKQEFKRNDYMIIGKVSGSSGYVYLGKHRKITGDSRKYGFINEEQALAITKKELKRNRKITPLEIARQNACYELIDKANSLGADTILEPLEQIETKVETTNHKNVIYYKVSMTALAVKFKRDDDSSK